MISNKDLLKQYQVFSNNIRLNRRKLNLTQERLAELSDLSISYIKQIESCKGYRNLTLTTMLKLSKTLNISINDLFKE